jgi:hypothetical protein
VRDYAAEVGHLHDPANGLEILVVELHELDTVASQMRHNRIEIVDPPGGAGGPVRAGEFGWIDKEPRVRVAVADPASRSVFVLLDAEYLAVELVGALHVGGGERGDHAIAEEHRNLLVGCVPNLGEWRGLCDGPSPILPSGRSPGLEVLLRSTGP